MKALYCSSLSEQEIAEAKSLGRNLMRMVHPDKGTTTDNTPQTIEEIKEFLINNRCGDSLNKLFKDRKKDISENLGRIKNNILADNYYRIITNRFLGGAAHQIGYEISTKFINKIMPETKRTEYILDKDFVAQSRLNKLLIESELNKYPLQLHLRD